MPWKVSQVMNERMRFVIRLENGERMTDLCREFGISRKTGYKFFKRYKDYGPSGIFDETRKPHRLARALPKELKEFILKSKKEHPTWGAKKLRAELEKKNDGVKLPCEGTVHAWLDQAGMVKKRKRRRHKSELHRSVAGISEAPNDLWCADFKGEFKLGDKKYCYPLTVSDHFSRYFIGCEGLENIKGMGSRYIFEAIFRTYGLPKAIRTDNGHPFAAPRGLGGLSKLSVWWLRLGISIERIEPGHPEQNSRHERLHLTLKQETTRPAGANLLQQQERFDEFVDEYNHRRPHEALDMKYPADLYEPSVRKYPGELPDIEYPLHDLVRIVSPGGSVSLWGRNRAFYLCRALEGEKVGLRELNDNKWLISFMHLDLGYLDGKSGIFEPTI